MNQMKETTTGFCIAIGIYAVIVEIFGLLLAGDVLGHTLGLCFGVIMAIAIFCHMAKTLDYALDLQEKDAVKYVRIQSFIRFLIMFLVLTAGWFVKQLSFIAVFFGLFGLKIGALFTPFVLKRLYPEHYITKEDAMEPDTEEAD